MKWKNVLGWILIVVASIVLIGMLGVGEYLLWTWAFEGSLGVHLGVLAVAFCVGLAFFLAGLSLSESKRKRTAYHVIMGGWLVCAICAFLFFYGMLWVDTPFLACVAHCPIAAIASLWYGVRLVRR